MEYASKIEKKIIVLIGIGKEETDDQLSINS